MPLPAHPPPAERSAGGQVGDGACSKFSNEGEPQLVWWGSCALGKFKEGKIKGSSPAWVSGTEKYIRYRPCPQAAPGIRINTDMQMKTTRTVVLKLWFGDAWASLRHFQGVCDVKTFFSITTPRVHLPFSRSSFHECTVEFSRGFMACVDVIILIANGLCVFQFKRASV